MNDTITNKLSPEGEAAVREFLGRNAHDAHVRPDPLPVTTKSRAEIDAEKAAKPRPDLIPATALEHVSSELLDWNGGADYTYALTYAMGNLANGARRRDARALARAWIWAAIALDIDEANADIDAAIGRALLVAGEVMAVGLRKHGRCTWRVAGTEQADPQCHYASACRHLAESLAGLEADKDSGRPPAVHLLTQIPILIDLLVDPPLVAGENDGHAMLPPPPVPVT